MSTTAVRGSPCPEQPPDRLRRGSGRRSDRGGGDCRQRRVLSASGDQQPVERRARAKGDTHDRDSEQDQREILPAVVSVGTVGDEPGEPGAGCSNAAQRPPRVGLGAGLLDCRQRYPQVTVEGEDLLQRGQRHNQVGPGDSYSGHDSSCIGSRAELLGGGDTCSPSRPRVANLSAEYKTPPRVLAHGDTCRESTELTRILHAGADEGW